MANVPLPEQFGRYRILRLLGKGGMGAVYLAHDPQLDRKVALKVPHFEAQSSPKRLERFYREAKAAAALDHPNICHVFEVGEVNGSPYLTMAFIEGKPLADLIEPDQAWPQPKAALLIRKLALALHEAHQAGVVHRDLKPSNIMINQRGEPVIMDFGLAQRVDGDEGSSGGKKDRLTKSGAVLGTPAYMPPEQVEGKVEEMGPACDIYSLGVILYELLTGRLPFEGPPAVQMGLVMIKEPPKPSEFRADIDSRLEAICLKTTAKKSADRYGSMKEFAAALTDYVRDAKTVGQSTSARPSAQQRSTNATATAPANEFAEPATVKGSAFALARTTVQRRTLLKLWLPAAGVAILALAGGIAYVASHRGTQAESNSAKSDAQVVVPATKPLSASQPMMRAEKNDYDAIATGKWIPVLRTSADLQDAENVKLENGALVAEGGFALIKDYHASDMIIRAKVKRVGGIQLNTNLALNLRRQKTPSPDSYSAWYNGGDWFGINVHRSGSWSDLANIRTKAPFDDYFEFAFAAVGDSLTMYANGKLLKQVRHSQYKAGFAAIAAKKGRSLFKDVEIMILDKFVGIE